MVNSVLVDEAAQLLGVSRRTIYYRIRDGQLRTIRTQCGSQRVLMESIEQLRREPRRRRRSAARVPRPALDAEALAFEVEALAGDPR